MDGIDRISKTISTPLGKFKYFSLGELYNEDHDVEVFPFSIYGAKMKIR